MALCPQCKGSNSDDARRCVWCGLPLHPATPERAGREDDDTPATGPAVHQGEDQDDPLAGFEGLLPPVPLPQPPESPRIQAAEPTEQELLDAALLYRIATEPAPLEPPRVPPAPPAPPLLSPRMRALFALLVLLAVLAPLVSGGRLDAILSPTAGQAALTQTLYALRAGDRVLVAFDYAPSAAAELAPVRDAVLADLAGRSVRIGALSTRPEGVDLARQSLERLGGEYPALRPGVDTALLGYLAGDAAGLRLALSDLPAALAYPGAASTALGAPVSEPSGNLAEMDALLVLTDDANVARRWVEQVGAWTDTPLMMVTTTAIEPMLAPYAGSGQVAALVSGALGGVTYSADKGSSLYSADGFLALWVVLAVAFIWGLLRRPAQRRERRA